MAEAWQHRVIGLRDTRRSLRLTTEQVAEAAGLDRSTISKYESLQAKPSEAALRAWEESLRYLTGRVRVQAEVALSGWEAQ